VPKFKEFETVRTLVARGKIPAGSVGTIICTFTIPEEAYIVEFSKKNGVPIDDPMYLPDELEPKI
jgi:hypothetical protein